MNKFWLIIVVLLAGQFSYAQNQQLADSLIAVYNSGSYEMEELDLLAKIA